MKKFLLLYLVCLLSSCTYNNPIDPKISDSYFIRSGEVTFCQQGKPYVFGRIKCDADINSLQLLSRLIIKDKTSIYYKGIKQEHVHHPSFYIDGIIPKDEDYAYQGGRENLEPIKDVDAASFQYINYDSAGRLWSKDKNSYYLNLKKVDVDYGSFKILNHSFASDKDSIYGLVNELDPEVYKSRSRIARGIHEHTANLSVINDRYLSVEDTLYYIAHLEGNKLKKTAVSKSSKARLISEHVLCIGDQVIVNGAPFRDTSVDANTFELLTPNYVMKFSRDTDKVYFDQVSIPDADPKTFEVMDKGPFAKDKTNVYYKAQILEADPNSFRKHKFVWKDDLGNSYNRRGEKVSSK